MEQGAERLSPHLFQSHHYSWSWLERDGRLGVDRRRIEGQSKAESLQDQRQHYQNFCHGKILANAGPRSCSKGKISIARTRSGVLRCKSLRLEHICILPP